MKFKIASLIFCYPLLTLADPLNTSNTETAFDFSKSDSQRYERYFQEMKNGGSINTSPNSKTRASKVRKFKQFGQPEIVVLNPKIQYDIPELRKGSILTAQINQDIIGYQGAVSPVKAIITEGGLRGGLILGNASQDKNTKNILIKFDFFRSKNDNFVAEINATVHSTSGVLGLKGNFNSNYWKDFWASLFINTAEGFSRSSLEMQDSYKYGQTVQNTSTNRLKTGLADSLSQSIQSSAQKTLDLPEYTKAEGPHKVKIFIIDEPITKYKE